jgi:antitoxin component YwqK of YwqJK toxin-antitoxin module
MKKIILIVAMVFLFSNSTADFRVLEQIRSKSHLKAKNKVSKTKKLKKKTSAVSNKKLKQKDIKPKKLVTKEELEIRNDLAYLPNEDKPFTGTHEAFHSNKKKYIETNYKEGKRDGLLMMWDENERKIGAISYKDGERMDF